MRQSRGQRVPSLVTLNSAILTLGQGAKWSMALWLKQGMRLGFTLWKGPKKQLLDGFQKAPKRERGSRSARKTDRLAPEIDSALNCCSNDVVCLPVLANGAPCLHVCVACWHCLGGVSGVGSGGSCVSFILVDVGA